MNEENKIVNPLVSIIVPVYKVEKYLERCLDSIVNQSYKNIEVILVDDGSPDRCGDICEKYAEKHSFIKVIHQRNQGQGAARNTAVSISAGDFITFVDSDDYIHHDCIEYLVLLQRKHNADIAIGGHRYIFEGRSLANYNNNNVEICMNTVEALNRLNYTKGYGATPWAKLFKRRLVKENPFPNGQIYEDLAVMYKIFSKAETIVYGNKEIYYWVQREGSTTRQSFDDRQMAALEATREQLQYIAKTNPEALPSAKARHEAKIIELMTAAIRGCSGKSNYKRLIAQSLFFFDVLKDKNVKTSLKVRMLGTKLGFRATKVVFWIHEYFKLVKYKR